MCLPRQIIKDKKMETLSYINYIIAIIFTLCYCYQFFYVIVPWLFAKKKSKAPVTDHKYAVLIAARNEEVVIGNLIESIKDQKYDSSLVNVFVVADNCTDKTAEIARSLGATVYERFNKERVGKGYAMEYLLDRINEDYGWDSFDGYFIFDADNVLDENYIAEMNKTFSQGYSIVTGYRNSKNYGDNWISAGYGLWFLRESQYLNRSRMCLGTSSSIGGTGFMFSREILENNGGWKFFLLTEDLEFTIKTIIDKERIGYCEKAMLFDEQPTSFRQSWRQRLRWSKGFLQVLRHYGKDLFCGIFRHRGFACYDMFMAIFPAVVITLTSLIVNSVFIIAGGLKGADEMIAVRSILQTLVNTYLLLWTLGAITTVTEWKKIHTSAIKKILYTFTFPIFMLTYIPINVQALFKKVEWSPIMHTKAKSLSEIRAQSDTGK